MTIAGNLFILNQFGKVKIEFTGSISPATVVREMRLLYGPTAIFLVFVGCFSCCYQAALTYQLDCLLFSSANHNSV
jgi:hypothetical protein